MLNLIVAHADFERNWPFAAELMHEIWQAQGPTEMLRLEAGDDRPLSQLYNRLGDVTRLAALGVPVSAACVDALGALEEATFPQPYRGSSLSTQEEARLTARGVQIYCHQSEGFWGQSVSEFALALTLCALRRIPQHYHQMMSSNAAWEGFRKDGRGPDRHGAQFSDDLRFTHGTIAGKRIRIVGAGNIGSRYASFVRMLGADVAAWDPFASEAHFHRAGSRRQWHLDQLVRDAQIFVPMLPLTESTRGLVTAEHIEALPQGTLVVLATRANICDMEAVRRRVLADEISLAADVHDTEPLPFDDPLMGRHNVVHTPHLAGRTYDSNRKYAEDLLVQFRPVQEGTP